MALFTSARACAAEAEEAHLIQVVPPAELTREASAMETLLQSLALTEPFTLEITGEAHRQRFLVRAPSHALVQALGHQLQAHYPGAHVRERPPDPLAMAASEQVLIAEYRLREDNYLPIRTFWSREMTQEGTDPLIGLLACMEGVGEQERIVLQLGLQRAPANWAARYQRYAVEHPLAQEQQRAKQQMQDVSRKGGTSSSPTPMLLGLVALLVGMQAVGWYHAHAWFPLTLLVLGILLACSGYVWWQLRTSDPSIYDMQLVATKLRRSGYGASMRVIIISPKTSSQERLAFLRTQIERGLHQYNLADGNGFVLARSQVLAPPDDVVAQSGLAQRLARLALPSDAFSWYAAWWFRRSNILSSLEASLWHLPGADAKTPLVERVYSRVLPAPPEVFARAAQGAGAIALGVSPYRLRAVPMSVPKATFLTNHTLIVGGTGRGKSTVEELIARGLMASVRDGSLQPGFCCIDPHGDLFRLLLGHIPPGREVIILDFADLDRPVGINVLDARFGDRDRSVANQIDCYRRIWPNAWGNRMEDAFSHGEKTLWSVNEALVRAGKADQQYTLLDLNPLFLVPEYQRQILIQLEDEELLLWWRTQFAALDRDFKLQVVYPVVNKLAQFSTTPALAHLMGQAQTTADVTRAVTHGAIVLVNLAGATIGDHAASIIGASLLSSIHHALQRQDALPRAQRRQVALMIDEFQKVPAGNHEEYLAENRKFGGALILATQSLKRLDQLEVSLRPSTFVNVGNVLCFGTSAEDARLLLPELSGLVEEPDLLNLQPFDCYARLTMDGHIHPPYSLQVQPSWRQARFDPVMHERRAQDVRQACRRLFPPAEEVEQRLHEHRAAYAGDLFRYQAALQQEVARTRALKDQREREHLLFLQTQDEKLRVRQREHRPQRQAGQGRQGTRSAESAEPQDSATEPAPTKKKTRRGKNKRRSGNGQGGQGPASTQQASPREGANV